MIIIIIKGRKRKEIKLTVLSILNCMVPVSKSATWLLRGEW